MMGFVVRKMGNEARGREGDGGYILILTALLFVDEMIWVEPYFRWEAVKGALHLLSVRFVGV